jgi:hypothetical protein
VSRWWLGTGARETAGKQRLTGAETVVRRDGERRKMASAALDRGGRDGGTGEASGRGVGGAREAGGAGEATVGGERREVRQLSGCAARCPNSGFKPRHQRGAWRRAATDKSGPLVSDFRIKIHSVGN